MSIDVAIQGEEGSNSAAAARQLFGAEIRLRCCETFALAFSLLERGEVATALLPIENTTAGLVREVTDRLGRDGAAPLWVSQETRVAIRFVAACLSGAQNEVRSLLAHPVAAAQCARFVAAAGLTVIPCHDTAGAARLVREHGDRTLAALCPPSAAQTYGLEILANDCGDEQRTVTRFVRVEREVASPHADDNRALVSLVLTDRPGALVAALSILAARGLNLCALHSRPVPGQLGAYAFLLEVEAGGGDPALRDSLAALPAVGAKPALLGSFRAPAWPVA